MRGVVWPAAAWHWQGCRIAARTAVIEALTTRLVCPPAPCLPLRPTVLTWLVMYQDPLRSVPVRVRVCACASACTCICGQLCACVCECHCVLACDEAVQLPLHIVPAWSKGRRHQVPCAAPRQCRPGNRPNCCTAALPAVLLWPAGHLVCWQMCTGAHQQARAPTTAPARGVLASYMGCPPTMPHLPVCAPDRYKAVQGGANTYMYCLSTRCSTKPW